ncbi:hypothetical protein HNY73_015643 [Argiope bruennichi]|uniref:Uncharacterized protein n=1 Tax=Argiope bruennichi TaxID=94029 RepID=A0A8T0EY97_ARGBR|nr:hypothetical protein HNY73_015643 [Argiope bruennichi]
MERDRRSDDSSSCKSSYSNRSVYSNKTFYNGNSTVASDFVLSIQNHCRDLKNWNRELTSAINRKCQTKNRIEGCSPSEKAGLLKRLEDINRLIKCNEEKLKNAKPCMNKGCRTHDGDRNLCAYISTAQERMIRLNYAASTFLDTLQQMKESKLEHTAQYTDDFAQLKKIQAEIRQIANELDDVTPCSVDNCERHTPEIVSQPILPVNPEHTMVRETTAMDTGNTPEKNNKDEDQPAQMDIEPETPFQPVDKRHTAKRKNSVENPDVSTCNKFQILEEETPQPKKEILPIHMKLTEDTGHLASWKGCPAYPTTAPAPRNRRSFADVLRNRNTTPEKVTEITQNPPAPRQRPQRQQRLPEPTPTLEAHDPQISLLEMKELLKPSRNKKPTEEFPGLLTVAAN